MTMTSPTMLPFGQATRKAVMTICGILPGTIAHTDGTEAGMTPGIMVPDGIIVDGTDGMTHGMTPGITDGIILAIIAGIILAIIITEEVAEVVTMPTMAYLVHSITDV